MITFIGDFVCRPDAKGRIVLPSHFKKTMVDRGQNCFVVRKDLFEECLILVPQSQWVSEVEVLENRLNAYRQKDRQLKRALYRLTAEVSLDGNGRFLVPKRLMDLVGVDGEVVLLGVGSSIELWSREAMERAGLEGEELGELAEELLGKDIVGE